MLEVQAHMQEAPEQYEENGDPYGDEVQEGLHGEVTHALAETRGNKKRAQEDVRMLANRIALLKLEEKKAWKKIEETKKKATEIMVVRQRNKETRTTKDIMRAQKDDDDHRRKEENWRRKQEQQDAIHGTRELNMMKNH